MVYLQAVAAEMILGYVFDKTEFPEPASREYKLAVARHAIRRFAVDHGLIDGLAFDGHLVSDDELKSDSWRTHALCRSPCLFQNDTSPSRDTATMFRVPFSLSRAHHLPSPYLDVSPNGMAVRGLGA
jgi:hypothetical protein